MKSLVGHQQMLSIGTCLKFSQLLDRIKCKFNINNLYLQESLKNINMFEDSLQIKRVIQEFVKKYLVSKCILLLTLSQASPGFYVSAV